MKRNNLPRLFAECVVLIGSLIAPNVVRADGPTNAVEKLARGKYLVQVAGCNDCHTPGFGEKQGQIPEVDWLTGVPIGWHGPWGTTYASNLRLIVNGMDEKAFIARMKGEQFRPPMPGYVTKLMPDDDLSAIFAFIKSLGPKGEKMPAGLPPGVRPTTPVLEMVPQVLPGG